MNDINTHIHKLINVYQENYKNGKCSGVGDFIRGSYFLMQFCDKFNIEYEISFYNHLLGNYLKNVDKKCEDKVIVSFTTTPNRINEITPMLISLLDQTARVDQIVMNIPEKCNDCSYDVPDEYKDICNMIVNTL